MAKIKLISEIEELRFQRDAVIEAADKLEAQRDAALAELAALRRQRDALRLALEAVEWYKVGGACYCHWCHWEKDEGHSPDCKRQAALALVRGE